MYKLYFKIIRYSERFWIKVNKIQNNYVYGIVSNKTIGDKVPKFKQKIKFHIKEIIDMKIIK